MESAVTGVTYVASTTLPPQHALWQSSSGSSLLRFAGALNSSSLQYLHDADGTVVTTDRATAAVLVQRQSVTRGVLSTAVGDVGTVGASFVDVTASVGMAAIPPGAVLRFGDVTGDGIADAVVTCPLSAPALFVNNGSGGYVNQTAVRGFRPSVIGVAAVAFADVDGDGDVDVYIAANGVSNATLLVNNGSGYFTDGSAARLPSNRSGNCSDVAVLDVDSDGDVELLVVTSAGGVGPSRLLVNNGSGYFLDDAAGRGVAGLGGVGGAVVSLADVNSDGVVDVVTSGGTASTSGVSIMMGDGKGGYWEDRGYEWYAGM